ncbi:MAG: hypothetical protein QW244_01470 [Candidatus Pacearchaeota archaeon]
MKKQNLILFIFFTFILITPLILSQTEEITKIKKAYSWLRTEGIEKFNTLTEKQASFTIFALKEKLTVDKARLMHKILLEKSYDNGTCWPGPNENDCNALTTAIVKLALDSLSKDTSKASAWLLKNSFSVQTINIKSFLQVIPITAETINCQIKTNTSTGIVSFSAEGLVNSIDSELTSCFASTIYSLQLNQSCLNDIFRITCDKDVKVNFIYKKSEGQEWYVTNKLDFVSAMQEKEIQPLKALCIAKGQVCDYEASLWAAIAFKNSNLSVAKSFLLYLISEASVNEQYLPEAFLYALTNASDYTNQVIKLQRFDGLFVAPNTAYNEYYDTGLAGVMGSLNKLNLTVTKSTLLNNQTREGFWSASNNVDAIRDTALILAGIWPTFTGVSTCEQQGYSCVQNCSAINGALVALSCYTGECCNINSIEGACELKAGNCTDTTTCPSNTTQVPYACSQGKCCKQITKSLCAAEINGTICQPNQKCLVNGTIVPFISSSDSAYCCIGNCISSTKACAEQGGEICDPQQKSCQNKWLFASDTSYCCQQGFCADVLLTCQQMGGVICEADQDCKGGYLVTASNTAGKATCCVQGGTCLKKTCEHNKCESDETCNGNSYETSDALKCCEGNCEKPCSSLGGNVCPENYKCKGEVLNSSDTTSCCIGDCVEKKGLPFFIIIILIIVIIFIILFFLIKKGYISKLKSKFKKKPTAPSVPTLKTMPTLTKTTRLASKPMPPTQPIQPRQIQK